MSTWWAPYALLPGGLARDVSFEIAAGRFTAVTPGTAPAGTPLPGVALPGLANAHCHAFHRALRGRTQDGGGTFWTWRTRMYAVAARLDPDSYLDLARAAYAEMALAGVTTVGEFHYLHHGPGGRPYADPNAMAEALRQAAADAGVRLTLLDACYLAGGLGPDGHLPLTREQLRFGDSTVDGWAERVAALRPSDGMRVGAAIHSVRAVPAAALPVVARAALPVVARAAVAAAGPGAVAAGAAGDGAEGPLHVHLSEQPAENEACLAYHGCTPAELLHRAGVLGPRTTAVHATHLTAADVATLGRTGTTACFCPTTERDLADGIGPARALADAGADLSLGSDQHAVTDLLEEARALEMHERLVSGERGRFTPAALLAAATNHASLGWPDAGRLAPGARADLVAIDLDTPRTAGADPAQILFAATAADVRTVLRDGVPVVTDGRHPLGEVGPLLAAAIAPLWT